MAKYNSNTKNNITRWCYAAKCWLLLLLFFIPPGSEIPGVKRKVKNRL